MKKTLLVIICGFILGGCGGQYILTVPDQLAPASGEATTVVRLQRSEVWAYAPAVKSAVMRFQVGPGLERAAYTDKLGYAGTTIPAGDKTGRFLMTVSHLDIEGDEVIAESLFYVWDTEKPVVAVDYSCLRFGSGDGATQRAISRVSEVANIVYMTRSPVSRHSGMHKKIISGGYQDGPILLWQRERWHVVREGRFKLPRVVVESRLVSQLGQLKQTFPKLNVGIGSSRLSAKAYKQAGMNSVKLAELVVGDIDINRLLSSPEINSGNSEGTGL